MPILWEEDEEAGASEESGDVQVGGSEEGMTAPSGSCEQCKVSLDRNKMTFQNQP